jgi:hypothetical protein
VRWITIALFQQESTEVQYGVWPLVDSNSGYASILNSWTAVGDVKVHRFAAIALSCHFSHSIAIFV